MISEGVWLLVFVIAGGTFVVSGLYIQYLSRKLIEHIKHPKDRWKIFTGLHPNLEYDDKGNIIHKKLVLSTWVALISFGLLTLSIGNMPPL